MATSGSFKISDLPAPIADLVKQLLATKDAYLAAGQTGIISAPTDDTVMLIGPGTDSILAAVAAAQAYNPPDTGSGGGGNGGGGGGTPGSGKPFGYNVDPVSDYGSCFIFNDRMKHARRWLASGGWNVATGIPLDTNGYPLQLPYNGTYVHTLLTTALVTFPNGRYVCTYDGDGTVAFDQDATVISSAPGHIEFNVRNSNNGVHMTISKSTQGNNVRNIKVIPVGATTTFYQPFLDRLAGAGVLRFMDWGKTNDTTATSWNTRTLPTYYTQNPNNGCSLEYMIELANTVGADPWICVPHQADDGYVSQLGGLISSRLGANRKVYIEYSNEVWNGIFPQSGWTQQQGIAKGFNQIGNYTGSASDDSAKYWAGIKYQAYRSGQIFKILATSIGSRMVRVLAAQADYSDVGRVLLESFADSRINSSGGTADALAIAPYFGDSVKSSSINEILTKCAAAVASQTAANTRANKSTADRFKVPLISYEGGQHLYSDDSAQQSAMAAANRDPNMGTIYDSMWKAWKDSGGTLFVHFSLCWRPAASGTWGLLERLDQDTPKWLSAQRYLNSL